MNYLTKDSVNLLNKFNKDLKFKISKNSYFIELRNKFLEYYLESNIIKSIEIQKINYSENDDSKFIGKSKYHDLFFLKKDKETFYFDLRGFINKKLGGFDISEIENVTIDTFASNNEYFSHRRAKKLGQDDYGRCISVIKKN